MSGDSQVTVFRSLEPGRAREALLVLDAVSIDADVQLIDASYCVLVSLDDFQLAKTELATYRDENPPRPPPPIVEPHKPAAGAAIGYIGALIMAAFIAEWSTLDIYSAARVDALAIREGDWGRLLTGLFLHGDLAHLLSNSAFGGIAICFAARTSGTTVALSAALLLGGLGNALNIALRPGTHLSIGASTSVFALLGLLGVFGWLTRLQPQYRWLTRLSPWLAAIALLGFTGTAGDNTDLGAHLWGFVVGSIAGWPLYRFRSTLSRLPAVCFVGGLAGMLLAGAWVSVLA